MATPNTYIQRKVSRGKDIAHLPNAVTIISDKTYGPIREVKANVASQSGQKPYPVTLKYQAGKVISHICACPSASEGQCKHEYALYFHLLADALIQCEVIAHA